MEKIDFKKKFKDFYNPSAKEVSIIEIPPMNYLMIGGAGNPNIAPEFQEATEALYGISYALKFMLKKDVQAIDYVVPPLEGLWWTTDMNNFSIERKDDWQWTLMIMQPEFLTKEMVNQACEQVRKKKNPPALSKVRFESLYEGLSAQIMHIGPYSAEAPTVDKLHSFIKDKGYEIRDKHHEIYLSDPRKAAPDKMKTVIRQPIK